MGKARGLKGDHLRLITSDGQPGLLKALRHRFTFVKQQRCIAHNMHNVVVELKRALKKPCADGARSIWAEPHRKETVKRFKDWEKKGYPEAKSALKCMRKDLYSCLRCHDLPKEQWKIMSTTTYREEASGRSNDVPSS